METLQTSVSQDWRGANNNVNASRTDWFILTADFWLDETLFPRVRKSFRDCDWMKKFPYEFFMRSILYENLSKYEIMTNNFLSVITIIFSQNNIKNKRFFSLKPTLKIVPFGQKSNYRAYAEKHDIQYTPVKRPCLGLQVGSLRGKKKSQLAGYLAYWLMNIYNSSHCLLVPVPTCYTAAPISPASCVCWVWWDCPSWRRQVQTPLAI